MRMIIIALFIINAEAQSDLTCTLQHQPDVNTKLQEFQTKLDSFQALLDDKVSSVDLSWKDEVAQATCTAILDRKAWMFAVRRPCYGKKSCASICAELAGVDNQAKSMRCIDSLHVYANTHPLERGLGPNDNGGLGIKLHRYFSCSRTDCGPNFCCCEGYY